MNIIEFKNHWSRQGIFNIHEVMSWQPAFDKNNLTRWVAKGYIVRLRRGWYATPEFLDRPDSGYVVAERIYRPSYISLQTAFGIYDMIPETVVGITSVTTLKTARFDTSLGNYNYYSVKPDLMFGYKPVLTADGRAWYLAHPEKALLDYLYLNPQYSSYRDFAELRFDDCFLADEFDWCRLDNYLGKFESPVLSKKVKILKKVYGIND